MSKVIRISEHTYRRLEKHVHGFDDTPDGIIQMLLNHYEGSVKQPSIKLRPVASEITPDLTHTKITAGHFAGTRISKWSELLHVAHKKTYEEMGSFDRLASESLSNLELGQKTDTGFKLVTDTPFSIQGASANDSWKSALHLAKLLDVPIEITVRWRDKEGAFRPGETETLKWESS